MFNRFFLPIIPRLRVYHVYCREEGQCPIIITSYLRAYAKVTFVAISPLNIP